MYRFLKEEVVERVGKARFNDVYARALMILKTDNRLVGAGKLRHALAQEAATQALGGRRHYIPPPWLLGGNNHEGLNLCTELIAALLLRLRLDGVKPADDRAA